MVRVRRRNEPDKKATQPEAKFVFVAPAKETSLGAQRPERGRILQGIKRISRIARSDSFNQRGRRPGHEAELKWHARPHRSFFPDGWRR